SSGIWRGSPLRGRPRSGGPCGGRASLHRCYRVSGSPGALPARRPAGYRSATRVCTTRRPDEAGHGGRHVRIVIVGAGIAGLTLAAALAKAGRRCVIVEQAQDFSPVGSGIRLAPNATRLLTGLGLGPALAEAPSRPLRRDILGWDDGRLLHSTPLGDEAEKRYGAPLLTLLRSDLHRILLDAVPEGTVRPGRYVTDVLENSDEVTLRCSDGREFHGDVAIGADGVHSSLRALLRPGRYRASGQAVYRGVVPADRRPDPEREPRIRIWVGADRNFTDYPVSGGRLSFS